MDSEHVMASTFAVALALALSVLCLTAKSCNDSDNQLHKSIVEKGCAYFGDGKFDCRHIGQ